MAIDFRKKETTIPPSMIRGEFLEWIPTYKYLGAEFHNKLKHNEALFLRNCNIWFFLKIK